LVLPHMELEMDEEIRAVQERIKKESEVLERLRSEVGKVIVGQTEMIDKIIIGLLVGGHLLIEGVPGLAKTLTVSTFAGAMNLAFKRIQFTPDMLPADLIGTMVYNQKTGEFQVKKGPIFSSIILADEINRAPAKTQSALLEAMQEQQVTIGDGTFKLDSTFLVIATQNPIEQHGTYPLPEAQVDRFMMKLLLDYPTKGEEMDILRIHGSGRPPEVSTVLKRAELERAREAVHLVYMDEKIEQYIVDIVAASRNPEEYELVDIKDLIAYGGSPRAWHRLILTYEAQAEDITPEDVIEKIFSGVEVP